MKYAVGDPIYIGKKEFKDFPATEDSVSEIDFKVTAIKKCAGNQEQGIRVCYEDESNEIRSEHTLYSPMTQNTSKKLDISPNEEVVGVELTQNDDGKVLWIDFICLKKDASFI